MQFARWVFTIAGVYGLLILTPMLAMEMQISRDHPPAITHPEYFYGFVGVALAWQVAFLVIATDPIRFRLMIIPAILEKASFVVTVSVLWFSRSVPIPILAGATMDLLLGGLFVMSWISTERVNKKPEANDLRP